MSVGSVLVIPASTEAQVEPEEVRAVVPVVPDSGEDFYGKTPGTQDAPTGAADPQDEVKMQFEPPGDIAVYQFVSQDGSLIVQVPSEQMLSIASEISQTLAQAASKDRL